VQLALDGDVAALRLCVDRIISPMKAQDSPIAISLEGTLSEKADAIISALAAGDISPEHADGRTGPAGKVLETDEFLIEDFMRPSSSASRFFDKRVMIILVSGGDELRQTASACESKRASFRGGTGLGRAFC
jgi:hypothetical protein